MGRQRTAQASVAVELIYNNIASLPHPDHGAMRLVYFGHTSEGQKKLTRGVAEAIVMLLESNGQHIVNGLTEAAALLQANGYAVKAPASEGSMEGSGTPTEAPTLIEAAS